MKAISIELENKSVANQYVHSANSLNEHLGSHFYPQAAKAHSRQSLEARLAPSIRPGKQPSGVSGQRFESTDEVAHGDKLLVQGTIDRDESQFLGLTERSVSQRVDNCRYGPNSYSGRGGPVQGDAARIIQEHDLGVGGGPQTATVGRDRYMNCRLASHPDPSAFERGDAAQGASDSHRTHDVLIGIRHRVPSASHPLHLASMHRTPQSVGRDSLRKEGGAGRDAVVCAQYRVDVHRPTVAHRRR